VLASIP